MYIHIYIYIERERVHLNRHQTDLYPLKREPREFPYFNIIKIYVFLVVSIFINCRAGAIRMVVMSYKCLLSYIE